MPAHARNFGLNADADFETQIFVKSTSVEVLRRELGAAVVGRRTNRDRHGHRRLSTGGRAVSATRGVLEALLAFRNPVGIVTKSTLILRDLDLLAELAQVARVRDYFTITTLDRDLWRSVEPGTPPPAQRLAAMAKLNAAGISDRRLDGSGSARLDRFRASINSVASAAADHGAVAFYPLPLRLAPLVREHYFDWVAQHAPELTARYVRAFTAKPSKALTSIGSARSAPKCSADTVSETDEARERTRTPPIAPPPLRAATASCPFGVRNSPSAPLST